MERPGKVNTLIQQARHNGRTLLEHEVLEILNEYKLPLPSFRFITYGTSWKESVLAGMDFPLVLKVVAPKIIHKSEVGGVKLNLNSVEEVVHAIGVMEAEIREHLSEVTIEGWLLRSYIPDGTELIAGSITDDQLGGAVMMGIGGVFTEAYKDVSFRLVPVSRYDALSMLEELKGQAILNGLRKSRPLNRNKIADFLICFSRMLREIPEIEECDLNPLICSGDSIMIADARIKLAEA